MNASGRKPADPGLEPSPWQCVETAGPWPFITRRLLVHSSGQQHAWHSRRHRKRLAERPSFASGDWLWVPQQLNWWIACLFMLGSFLFAAGCLLSLVPALAEWSHLSSLQINTLFFAGSIPFTSAAYLQLFQAANAPVGFHPGAASPARRQWFGWKPRELGWLSCALQFPGTVLFNFNTFDTLIPGLTWLQQDVAVWAPNIAGSILFLASGHFAFVETCHAHWAWKPRDLSWWVTFINLLGCVGFMVAAVFAFVPPHPADEVWVTLSLVFTLWGAVCFFVGSFLMLPEGAPDPTQPGNGPLDAGVSPGGGLRS